jgi:chorismate dehydratase
LKPIEVNVPRMAASSYLNTAPLIWSFTYGSMQNSVELLTDSAPAVCGDMLANGDAEIALVPVIEYQRIPGILVVPNICVGSRTRVRSVVLATRCNDLRDVRTIALDSSSRTSSVLIQIIFREFMGIDPECRRSAPDLSQMLETSDAALIIGDPAMVFSRDDLHVHDLAEMWHDFTGLGFVFAMWMARESAVDRVRGVDLSGARDEGLEHIADIVAYYQPRLGMRSEELRTYLLDNITFMLEDDMRSGLDLYFKLAYKYGYITSVRPLRMLL